MAQPAPQHFPIETNAQREARLAWERERIAEGDADIAAGRVIKDEELDSWLAAWVAGEPLPDPA